MSVGLLVGNLVEGRYFCEHARCRRHVGQLVVSDVLEVVKGVSISNIRSWSPPDVVRTFVVVAAATRKWALSRN